MAIDANVQDVGMILVSLLYRCVILYYCCTGVLDGPSSNQIVLLTFQYCIGKTICSPCAFTIHSWHQMSSATAKEYGTVVLQAIFGITKLDEE